MTPYLRFLLKAAFDDLRRNKVRTILTSLGILIGVFAVVTLIALGTGLKNYIEGQFQGLGVNTIYVLPGRISGGGFSQTIPTTTFDERDAIRLARLNEAEFVVPIQ